VAAHPVAQADLACRLGANEIYGRLKSTVLDIAALVRDGSDYKALIAQATDTAEKLALAQKLATRRHGPWRAAGTRRLLCGAAPGDRRRAAVGAVTETVTITENAKIVAVRHIAPRTDELVPSAGEAQVRAMEETPRAMFRNELGPALQRLAGSLQRQPRFARVETWLTHAAVALLASALSWAMAVWLWTR
jgi:hypothetical protein